MKKEQFIAFLKAPLSKNFGIVYLFGLFLLLSTPLFCRIFKVLFENSGSIAVLPKEQSFQFIANLMQQNLTPSSVALAVTGVVIFFILLSAAFILLVHKTVNGKAGIFDVEETPLPLSRIFASILKSLGLPLLIIGCFWLVLGLFFLGAIFLGTLIKAMALPTIFMWLFGLAYLVLGGYLIYRTLGYTLSATYLFYKDFKLAHFFKYTEVQNFFATHKAKVLLSVLLFFIFSQITSTLYMSLGQNMFTHALRFQNMSENGLMIMLAIGLLIFGIVAIYLNLLQAIITGKITLWVWNQPQNQKHKR